MSGWLLGRLVVVARRPGECTENRLVCDAARCGIPPAATRPGARTVAAGDPADLAHVLDVAIADGPARPRADASAVLRLLTPADVLAAFTALHDGLIEGAP